MAPARIDYMSRFNKKRTSNTNSNLNRTNKNVSGRDPNITLPKRERAPACMWQCSTFWFKSSKLKNSYFDIWRKQGTGFWTSDTWAPPACEKVQQKPSESTAAFTVVNVHVSSNITETKRECEIKDWNSPGKHHTGQKSGHIMVRHPPTFDPGKCKKSTGR